MSDKRIPTLRKYLQSLPSAIPYRAAEDSQYKFHQFSPDAEWIKEEGLDVAVNRELEAILGSRLPGYVEVKERGPGLEALADVLDRYLELSPQSFYLDKWLDDILTSVKRIYELNGEPIPDCQSPEIPVGNENGGSSATSQSSGRKEQAVQKPTPGTKRKKQSDSAKASGKSKKKKDTASKPDTLIMTSFEDPDYVTSEEDTDDRTAGVRLHPLLPAISKPCRKVNSTDPEKKHARCICSRECGTSWAWKRPKARVLLHAMNCQFMPADLRCQATEALAADGKSGVVAKEAAVKLNEQAEDSRAKQRADVTANTQKMLPDVFQTEGRKRLKTNADRDLVSMLACCGLSPTLADAPEFKKYSATLNAIYKPPSSSWIRDFLLPQAAAKVKVMTIELLQDPRERHQTLTFDGGKKKKRSFFTVHSTTAEGRALLLELSDVSGLSHTANLIKEIIERWLIQIGPHNVSGIVSDNASNTAAARRLISAAYPHIVNMQDCCHELDLAIEDICRLEEIKQIIGPLREILAFMSRSGYATELFDKARVRLDLGRGLEFIGETRFGTVYWSAESVRRNMEAFRAILDDKSLGITLGITLDPLLERGSVKTIQWELQLTKLIAILGPFSKAIKCLEHSRTTAGDVFLFWLAILAQLSQLFESNAVGLETATIEEIRAITNTRFEKMITGQPDNLYALAFFLDPRYRNAPIFKHRNPLAVPAVTIKRTEAGPVTLSGLSDKDVVKEMGLSLLRLLKKEYGDGVNMKSPKQIENLMQLRNPDLAGIIPAQAINSLRNELDNYTKGRDPFNRRFRSNETVLDWWKAVRKDELGRVLGALAVKIYSISVNSMADERSVSTVTWLSQGHRSTMSIGTLNNNIAIRQWERWDPETIVPLRMPTPKWRDMQAMIFARRGTARGNAGTTTRLPEPDQEQGVKRVIDDDVTWLDEPTRTLPAKVMRDRLTIPHTGNLKLNDLIDLASPFLLDVLSDTPQGPSVEAVDSDRDASDDAVMDDTPLEWDKW
ncbi:hypothetical protein GLOTRDRAFT_138137 [Gloeophyllum trabeum ATCC 11539]|uniref:DUF659 domain-containing protein n=1 Tax=Gloeophyllum trabeum (strain ATCC 11539 / FP-39264 / Madison 617) TaxID=670483 RepID=S7Q8U4_GLOTA|nr:uncharacterized protein GLOTRDRAFT_138137 [Gloeophyllum trabeum ATCC 11539]EPQ56401.1 hypothetical protein GLOTRDRAFT_138137 [Gloeophyllum trabeum ATCC 11539]